MTLFKSLLLGSAAGIVAIAGASAADLPSKKAAPATYVKICDAYGAGFFYIPGTETCVKVGGYVRVDYDYRPERKNTNTQGGAAVVTDVPAVAYVANTTNQVLGVAGVTRVAPTGYGNSAQLATTPTTADTNTIGFYNRGTIQIDARTPTSMGVARTFMALRLETGSGPQAKSPTGASREGAYVQWAGFTAGQGAQPFAFMSSWAYNTHYWGGWPNGVRQLTYTAVLGGGFSATVGITDMKNYNTLASAAKDSSNQSTAIVEGVGTPDYNGIVYVGNVRYDQSWGAAQVMGAFHTGGNLDSLTSSTSTAATAALLNTTNGTGIESGWALGAGVSFKLPMLAAGDELQATFVYADHLANLLADGTINTPSASAYGSNPIGGPSVNFNNGTGWVAGAQFRHFFTSQLRTQLYASYTQRNQTWLATGATEKGSGNATSLGAALIYAPVKDLDIGLEVNYIRASWDQAAVRSLYPASSRTVNNNWMTEPAQSASNVVTKLRIQRNF